MTLPGQFGMVGGARNSPNIWTTNFSEYLAGQTPHDWSNRYTSTGQTFTVENVSGSLSGKALRWTRSGSNARRAWSWDRIPAGVVDSEILFRLRLTSAPSALQNFLYCWVRGAGGIGTETGRRGGLGAGTVPPGDAGLLGSTRYDNGVADGPPESTPFAVNLNTWYWVRCQFSGAAMRLKAWAASGSEPGPWMRDDTVAGAPLGAGWIGVQNVTVDPVVECDFFGVAINGASVPLP